MSNILKSIGNGALDAADTFNNINIIQNYLNTPTGERKSLDGLDAAIATVATAATVTAVIASSANSGPTTTPVGAALAGTAFQLNGAVASASLAATVAYVKQGQFDKAASTSLASVACV